MKKFCAHRGVSSLMPENTLPSFAAALSLGADEIEFDVRLTKDMELIVSHDNTLKRITGEEVKLNERTLSDLKKLNIGTDHGWMAHFCTAEEIFEQFANRMTFNIHIKEHGEDGYLIRKLLLLINQFDAHHSVYFSGSTKILSWMEQIAPEIPRVIVQLPKDTFDIFEMAQKYHCAGVQFWLGMFDKKLIDKFHENYIFCNLFHADDEENYQKFFDMGIDTILTNRMDIAADCKARLLL